MPLESAILAQGRTNLTKIKLKGEYSFLPLVLTVVLCITVFYPSLWNGFVNWDDDVNLLQNPNLRVFNLDAVKAIFSSTILGNYNPLPILTFAIEKHFFSLNPFVFHLNNLLLHLLCVVQVFLISKKINLSPWAAGFVAAIFAIHPMHVESVSWITERKDLFYTFFFLSGIWFYLKYKMSISKKGFYLILVYAFFLLSCFSKIQAVSFPLVLIAVDFLMGDKIDWFSFVKKSGFFLIALFFGVLGIYLLADYGSVQDTPFQGLERIFIGAYSFAVYIFKFFIPLKLSAVYPYPTSLSAIHFSSIIIFPVYLFLLYKSYIDKRRMLFFSFWFFLVNIIFVLQFLGAGQAYLADRFTYLAYLGPAIGIAYWMDSFRQNKLQRNAFVALCTLMMIFFSWKSFQQIGIWKNGITLWSNVIDQYPSSDLAYHNLGFAKNEQNNFTEALRDYNKAIQLNKSIDRYYNSRAKTFLKLGKTEEAISDYSMAIDLNPKQAEFYSNRAVVYGSQNDFQRALQDLNIALQLKPDYPEAYLNRALLYAHQGEFSKALKDNISYLQYFPEDIEILTEAGMNARVSGKAAVAKDYLQKALKLNPSHAVAIQEWKILTQSDQSSEDN